MKSETEGALADDAHAFEMAMVRARLRWRAGGKKGTFRDLLEDANKDFKQHQERIAAELADIKREPRTATSQ